jgi:hypothetical protein
VGVIPYREEHNLRVFKNKISRISHNTYGSVGGEEV